MNSPDFVIVGAGAVGAATAYELVRSGARVCVVERSSIEAGCSYGSAGLISPSHSETLANPASIRHGIAWLSRRDSPFHIQPRLAVVPWLARFAAASLPKRSAEASETLRKMTSQSLELHAELAQAGLPTSFARRGILGVYETEQALELARRRSPAAANGSETRILSPQDARALLPTLTPDIAGAFYYPREAHCDPAVFVQALLHAARELGADVRTGVEILRLQRAGGRIGELQTTAGPIRAGATVLAAGVWTRELAREVGVAVPLEGGKGYHLEVDASRSDGSVPAFLEEARITATPLDGRTRFTGILELSGLDLRVDPVRLEAIARAARRTVGMPGSARPLRIWRGLRPCAPDGLPIIGRAEGIDNLYIATGHAMLGIALAPVTARVIGAVIRGDQPSFPLAQLSPSRFQNRWTIMHNRSHNQASRS